jgi:hypothetical protein
MSFDQDQAPPRVPPFRLRKLMWVPLVLGMAGVVVVNGWPHLLWSFVWTGDPDNRTYLSCNYVGRYSQRIEPADGKCPYVLFFKSGG